MSKLNTALKVLVALAVITTAVGPASAQASPEDNFEEAESDIATAVEDDVYNAVDTVTDAADTAADVVTSGAVW